ncbi:MAG TPA: DUF1559 domain-containing protein, partial [Gemmataceae bacterium]|nr:DUF1559 domain-containing protein [Gemmataceae bacterium]
TAGMVFPPSYTPAIPEPTADGPKRQLAGWGFQLLPYVEQENLYRGNGFPNSDGKAANAMMTPLKIFRCPSVGKERSFALMSDAQIGKIHPASNTQYNALTAAVLASPGLFQTDYAANGGVPRMDPTGQTIMPPVAWGGAFLPYDGGVRPKLRVWGDFKDGQSNTLLLGEKLLNKSLMGQPQADDFFGYCAGWYMSTVRFGADPYNPVSASVGPSNSPQQHYNSSQPIYNGGRFGATHPGGCQFVFGDGSVQSVSFNVDPVVFARLCDIADGGVVSESDYN